MATCRTSAARRLACVLVAVLASGCAHSYTLHELPLPEGRPSEPAALYGAAPMMIELPSDGTYGMKRYIGSGKTVQRAIISALHTFSVDAREAQPSGTGASRAWRVTPRILEWEDRATQWSGKPDRISIELTTTDPNGEIVDAALATGISKRITVGRSYPEELLRPAILRWAARFRPHRATP